MGVAVETETKVTTRIIGDDYDFTVTAHDHQLQIESGDDALYIDRAETAQALIDAIQAWITTKGPTL